MKRILLVDDDQYIRELYEEVLSDAGYTVETATDGEDALIKLHQGGYDLVLLDIVMPKRDGLSVLDALRSNPPKQPNGPILLLTNLGQEEVIKDAISKGVTSFLIKAEMTPDQLLAHVRRYLGIPPSS